MRVVVLVVLALSVAVLIGWVVWRLAHRAPPPDSAEKSHWSSPYT
jgi:Flp pilus assembly protein CpaB